MFWTLSLTQYNRLPLIRPCAQYSQWNINFAFVFALSLCISIPVFNVPIGHNLDWLQLEALVLIILNPRPLFDFHRILELILQKSDHKFQHSNNITILNIYISLKELIEKWLIRISPRYFGCRYQCHKKTDW